MTVDPESDADRDRLEELVANALALHEAGDAGAVERMLQELPAAMAALVRDALGVLRAIPGLGAPGAIPGFPSHLGEFRLRRRLGGGGMGVVFLAEQESLRREVAVKVVRADLLDLPGMRERFRREVEAVARMRHPGIVPILAVGEQDGLPWFAMELVPGCSAAEVVARLRDRDPAQLHGSDLRAAIPGAAANASTAAGDSWTGACANIAAQVAEAIAHAHGRGIVHRDLKPSNVMLLPDGRVQVLDFGLAHVRGGTRLTRTGGSGGSPLYMSPEQLQGEAIDERTDVYSLGVLLWELVALRPPFAATDPERLRAAVVAGDSIALRQQNRTVSRDLELVLRKAMDPERRHRYADMESFAADLHRLSRGEPVHAAAPGIARRLRRVVHRHRVASAVATTLLLVLAVLPLALWLAQRDAMAAATTAQERAERNVARSLDTIDRLLAQVGSDRLLHVPAMEAVRTEILADAVACYRGMLTEESDNRELQRRYANCLGELAEAYEQTSRVDLAERCYRDAITSLRQQDDTDRRVAGLRRRTQVCLGRLLAAQGRVDDGQEAIRATMAELEQAVARAPDDVDLLEDLAGATTSSAVVERSLDHRAAAAAATSRALQITRHIAELRPRSATAQRRLADFCSNQSVLEFEAGHRDESLRLADEAIGVLRRLEVEDGLPRRSVVLAKTLVNKADLVDGDQAVALMEEAMSLLQGEVDRFPASAENLFELAAAEHGYGNVLQRLDREGDAMAMFERARQHQLAFLTQRPGHQTGLRFLRNHVGKLLALLAQKGDHTEMARVAEDLLRRPGPEAALEAAGAVWYCASKTDGPAGEILRSRCHELLHEAARRGRVPPAILEQANIAAMADDPEFQSLRARLVQE